ncbi:MAG: DUF6691 family protein [Myxococcota bacterium]|nr:DUF6691 family protein [Myxococcota bacterium]
MSRLVTFLAGIIFAIGLGISGMTQPAKVIGFLDLVSGWDPSLAFVMCGAIGIHCVAYQIQPNFKKPLYEDAFQIPKRTDLPPQLFVGSALFGAGWAVGGFCPGPALVSVVSLHPQALTFVGAMLAGMLVYQLMHNRFVPAHASQAK